MFKKLPLSQRLQSVASYLTSGTTFADIGSDHAYLPCYVCLQDETVKAIAGEINEGPFRSAVETVRYHDLTNAVEVRLGNGLQVLHKVDNVEQLVIAGMGGALIKTILEEGQSKLDTVQRIIAQPNIDARNVRKWLLEHEYTITDETILEENGHIYEIIVADKGEVNNPYQEAFKEQQLLFGPILLEKRTDVFNLKWQSEYEKLKRIIEQMKKAKQENAKKISQFETELHWIKEVLQNEK